MKILKTPKDIIDFKSGLKTYNSWGFVPTMGALHKGHIDLVKKALAENDGVICSIFVNPTQFNNKTDLEKYPRTFEQDFALLTEAGCNAVFAPEVETMYPALPNLRIDFGNLEHIMEGEFRPGHFNGVGIVVSKLFNMVQPTKAYFGQKDIQQVAVVNRLIQDLGFQLELVICETIREENGLAMSSRNRRLTESGKEKAKFLYETLKKGQSLLQDGKDPAHTKELILNLYKSKPEFKLEYYEICDFENLEPLQTFKPDKKTAIILAAFFEEVRLIDNLVF